MRPIDYFDKAADRWPDRTLAVSASSRCTYAEGKALSRRIAAALHADGLEHGDGVAVLSGNEPAAFVTMLGLWRAGGVWNPLNPRNPIGTHVDYMNDVATRWLFYDSKNSAVVEQLRAAVPTLQRTICVDELGSDVPTIDDRQLPDWACPRGNPDSVAAIMPTGGTTGRSKGVVMTNQVLATMIETATRHWPSATEPVNLMVAPITHGAGGVALILSSVGATLVMRSGFDPADTLKTIESERVTHLFLPPVAYYALLDHPDLPNRDLSSLQMLLLTSAPVSPERLARGVERIGPCLCQAWGQTEAPIILTWLSPADVAAASAGDRPERLGSCGHPTFGTRVAVMDDEGRVLPTGEVGELVVRSRLVTPGYHERPDETAEAQAHGWHHTGDIGRMDDDGYVYIVDRKKDVIITGGFNVFSTEVESAILTVPGVRQCGVIGIPDEKWGEAVTALVVTDPEVGLDEATVQDAVRAQLGAVKTPKGVHFEEALPMTAVGKVDKKALRARFWQGRDRQVN